jgi:hypothetical protein
MSAPKKRILHASCFEKAPQAEYSRLFKSRSIERSHS